MNQNFLGAVLLAEDAAPGMVLDFLNAHYKEGFKSNHKENFIYMNRKQRVADKVASEFFSNNASKRRVSVQ